MRILYHHRTLGDGAEGVHVAAMIAAFRQLGHQVLVVALAGEPTSNGTDSLAPDLPAPQINDRPLSKKILSRLAGILPGVTYELAELAYNVPAKRRLRRAIRSFQPDFVYDRYNSFSTAAIDAAASENVPVCLEVNAPVALERRMAGENRPLRLEKLAIRCERRICRAADRVVVVSTPLKTFLVEQRGVSADRVSVIPNGADPIQFDPQRSGDDVRRRLGIEGRIVVGFIGILRRWHGVDLLVDGFERIELRDPLPHLLIVGDGPIEAELRELVNQKGLQDRVTFTGRIVHSQVQDYLAAFDIAVSPRATFYASPMKILESMAMGTPIVAADTENIRDLISDGHDGLLFQPEDSDSLAKAIQRLAEDRELASTLGRNSRTKVEEERNWLSIAKEVASHFER
ncbi:Mannosylfructose-phosphate synthase [Rubripirellula tenax]|uniref:Mannosylfructose-phosphate synthase n=1 Tax=Rubripirellula tenax TaxID=2528015 RepID=A0A5C6F3X5_9BACT|nr:glycosyltransferase family 4 protein [Rubripirellula tenax]TWU54499.1 Mannosylfructose-phosphate synthase [Rubripirellula tenax]